MAKAKTTPALKEFDRDTAIKIMAEVQAALEPIAQKYGLSLDRKGRSYRSDALPVMYQFTIAVTDEDGAALSLDAKEFQKRAHLYGLTATDLGREFSIGGTTYRISGLRPKARKHPLIAEDVRTGRKYKFDEGVITRAILG